MYTPTGEILDTIRIFFIIEDSENELQVYQSPVFLFDESSKIKNAEITCHSQCEDRIRLIFEKEKIYSLEAFEKVLRMLLLKCGSEVSPAITNYKNDTGLTLNQILNFCCSNKKLSLADTVYVYNGSKKKIEVLDKYRRITLLKPGKAYYHGHYRSNKKDRQFTFWSEQQVTGYPSRYYPEEEFVPYHMKNFHLSKLDMQNLFKFYGDECYFEINGHFSTVRDLGYYWTHECLSIEDVRIYDCLDYKKYGEVMLENRDEYQYIMESEQGGYIVSYGDF